MPVEILTAAQRAEWERFPEEVDEGALAAFFCFADDELEAIAAHRSVHGRFAIAAAVGALRWLGFVPAALDELPVAAATLIAAQLDVDLSSIAPARLNVECGARAEHLAHAMAISAFRPCGDEDLDMLRSSVGDRALGHDGPLALMRHAVDCLRRERVVRPGLTVLERLVATARHDSEQEIYRRVEPILTPGLAPALDELLAVAPGATAAPVKALGQETRSVARIGEAIAKLDLLRELGAEQWELDVIPANRRRALAQYVRHASSQAIGRRDRTFRDPALLAFCAEAAARATDEIVDLFDDGIAAQHAKARRGWCSASSTSPTAPTHRSCCSASCWRSCWTPRSPTSASARPSGNARRPRSCSSRSSSLPRSSARSKTLTCSSSAIATEPPASSPRASSRR